MVERVDKKDNLKAPMQLLGALYRPLQDVARVLDFGNRKYLDVRNYRTIENGRDRYLAAALRHILADCDGQANDPESCLPHLAHATCCTLMAAWFSLTRPEAPNVPRIQTREDLPF